MDEFKKLNEKFNDDTYPNYPYISEKRITLLYKGLYKKYKAKYRGVTAVYDPVEKKFIFPLYGMYYVPENLVIVPPGLKINESKAIFLSAAVDAKFKRVDRPPTFKPITFPEDSPEARMALANKSNYYNSKRKDITI